MAKGETLSDDALRRLRRDARTDEAGLPISYTTPGGDPITATGDKDGLYVAVTVKPENFVTLVQQMQLEATYTTLDAIQTDGYNTITFFWNYTSAGADGQFSFIIEGCLLPDDIVIAQSNQDAWTVLGVLDGTVTLVTPPSLVAVYGSRTLYAAEFRCTPVPNITERIQVSLPFSVTSWKFIRMKIVELGAELGVIDIGYALTR